jgi:tetratricopeptide (TPR) repeat protein
MPLTRHRSWQTREPACCSCAGAVVVERAGDTIKVADGVMPNVPGAVCPACLPVVEGLVINDVRDHAASHLLRTASFELKTIDAVQVFLDLHGWSAPVVAAGAMRLHLDGHDGDAYALLRAAAAATPDLAGWYRVEEAGLRVLDGAVGQALDLLEASNPDDHPCWHLHHGLLARSLGRTDAAEAHWRDQVRAQPDEPLGWKLLAWHHLQESEDAGAAEALLSEACERFPEAMEFRAWLGHALYRQERRGEALRELEASRRLEASDPQLAADVDTLLARIRDELAAEG